MQKEGITMAKTIKQFIDESEALILPSIQRNYVWDQEQICSLFDSIMSDYPIGHIMLWELSGEVLKTKGIDFYRLLTHYDEMLNKYNEKIENPSPEKSYYGILDGQQRTQSLYLGLRGYLKLKIFRARKDNVNSFREKRLYINLISNPADDDDYKYEFKFLAESELGDELKNLSNPNLPKKLWFRVGHILTCNNYPNENDLPSGTEHLSDEERQHAKNTLNILYNHICVSDNILKLDYIPKEKSLDDVLNIFVRTNSGGTILNKTDLLFSTLVAEWPNSRKNIEDLLDTINNKGGQSYRFGFNKDFIIRTLMYLLDEPITLKIKDLKNSIQRIKENWEQISNSIESVIELLRYCGYSNDNITAYNAVMPIIYYLYKGGNLEKTAENNPKEEFKKYLIISQMKGLFGVASNSTLTSIRTALTDDDHNLKNRSFNLSDLDSVSIVGDRNYNLDEDTIEGWFEETKGSRTFMVLSLLYPCADISNHIYHQDHMHPESKLKKIEAFKFYRNKLANLQLLPGEENESKNAKDLAEWVEEHPEERDIFLPKDIDLSIDNYFEFLNERKKLMKERLLEILHIPKE